MSVDFSTVMLAQITDLQRRLTNQEGLIASLQQQVDQLKGVRTQMIPLTHSSAASTPLSIKAAPFTPKGRMTSSVSSAPVAPSAPLKRKPRMVEENRGPIALSTVLRDGENVTICVRVGDSEETTCLATFDGTNLNVKKCDLAPSLVGTSSSKPGEILYKFIDLLKEGGHIKRTFTIAPWKLCFVERDGKKMSLEELRG